MIFYKDYEDHFDNEATKNCTEFWRCFITNFDWTFKFTGALGSNLVDPDTVDLENLGESDEYDNVDPRLISKYVGRFFFDNIFNISLVMILVNMI